MKELLTALMALSAPFAPAAHGDEEGRGAGAGEIRVYLADKDKNPVALTGITVLVLIEPEGATRKMLQTELVTPKGGKRAGIGRGGEVVQMDGYHVEFLVLKPHAPHEGKAVAGHGEDDGTPYFKAAVDLDAYSCGMKGHPVVGEPGTCSKCPMKLKSVEREFRAVVIFRIQGDTKNAKGFQYPPVVPDNFKDAVAKIGEHVRAIEGLVKEDDNDKAHAVALKITRICEKLPELASVEDREKIASLSKQIIALFKEIDEAAHAGNKDMAVKAAAKYGPMVIELKKHIGGPDHPK